MCLVNGCANPPVAGYAGAGVPICQNCFNTINAQVQLRIANNAPPLPAGMLADYTLLKALMQYGTAIVDGCWQALDQELTNARLQQGMFPEPHDERFDNPKHYQSYVRLSRALEYYEGLCWFPVNRMTFPGLLTAPEFLASLDWGFSKDPGAGAQHGDLSHRFQWHAVMRIMTTGFTVALRAGWTNTPVAIYLSMFSPGNMAWAYVFDRPGTGGDAYSHPDNVLVALRNGAGQWPLIAPNLVRRANKRDNFDQAITNGMNAVPAHRRPLTAIVNVGALRQKLYTWKKTGGPPINNLPQGNARYTDDQYAFAVWQHVQQNAAQLLQNAAQTLQAMPNAPNILTSQPANTPVQTVNNMTLLQAQGGFNTTKYRYDVNRGARPQ